MPLLVERQVGEREHVPRQRALRAAEYRLHARDDLGEAERLGHVVVAAGAQRLDLVLGCVLRGQEKNRALEAALAEPPPDLDSVDVGEHPVEHDQVGLALGDETDRLASRCRLVHVVALVPERGGDRVDDRRLVVDDEDALAAHRVSLASVPVGLLRTVLHVSCGS